MEKKLDLLDAVALDSLKAKASALRYLAGCIDVSTCLKTSKVGIGGC